MLEDAYLFYSSKESCFFLCVYSKIPTIFGIGYGSFFSFNPYEEGISFLRLNLTRKSFRLVTQSNLS